jgi:hypothetical protein
MKGSREKMFTGDINFGPKMNERYSCFVPGEQVQGVAFLKMTRPLAFKFIHVEMIGSLILKHKYNPNMKEKEREKKEKDTLFDKQVIRLGDSHSIQYGEDTVSYLKGGL